MVAAARAGGSAGRVEISRDVATRVSLTVWEEGNGGSRGCRRRFCLELPTKGGDSVAQAKAFGARPEGCLSSSDGRWRLLTRAEADPPCRTPVHRTPVTFLNSSPSSNSTTATLQSAATMKISNSAVPVYTISGSEARPLPEWLIRQRKRYVLLIYHKTSSWSSI
jgi:hypothetical protein